MTKRILAGIGLAAALLMSGCSANVDVYTDPGALERRVIISIDESSMRRGGDDLRSLLDGIKTRAQAIGGSYSERSVNSPNALQSVDPIQTEITVAYKAESIQGLVNDTSAVFSNSGPRLNIGITEKYSYHRIGFVYEHKELTDNILMSDIGYSSLIGGTYYVMDRGVVVSRSPLRLNDDYKTSASWSNINMPIFWIILAIIGKILLATLYFARRSAPVQRAIWIVRPMIDKVMSILRK